MSEQIAEWEQLAKHGDPDVPMVVIKSEALKALKQRRIDQDAPRQHRVSIYDVSDVLTRFSIMTGATGHVGEHGLWTTNDEKSVYEFCNDSENFPRIWKWCFKAGIMIRSHRIVEGVETPTIELNESLLRELAAGRALQVHETKV